MLDLFTSGDRLTPRRPYPRPQVGVSQEFLDLLAKGAPNAHAEILLDTNVMLEIYSIGALLRLADELGSEEAALTSTKYRYRQLRARHSTLLAWWLSKEGRVVGMLGNEFVDQLELMAPPNVAPDEDATATIFTKAILHVIRPLVLSGFKAGPLVAVDHVATGTKADTEILTQAAGARTPLVTHEGWTEAGFNDHPKKLRGRAKALGVPVFTAREYLDAQGVNLEAESRLFVDALREAVRQAKQDGVLQGHEVLDDLVPVYRFIMLDEVNAKYRHIVRPA